MAYFTYPDGFCHSEWDLIFRFLRRSPSLPFNEAGRRMNISIDEAEELVKDFRFYLSGNLIYLLNYLGRILI